MLSLRPQQGAAAMIPGCHATAELAMRRRAAAWLALAIGLALQWATPDAVAFNSNFTSAGRTVAAGIATPAPLGHNTPQPADVESGWPEQEHASPTVAELSDEFLAAARTTQTVQHGSTAAPGAGYSDPCAASPRAFHPRAPPRTA
jgi:hypothetical protein